MGGLLEGYADRGVFRGFSRGPVRNGKAPFKMVWHRDRNFDLVVDLRKHTIHCPLVLPRVPAGSPMYRDFKSFLKARQDEKLPDHRRIDPRKARIACANRSGNVSLTLAILDRDYEYGIRKFIHLVQEIFLMFLADHFDYQVEAFGLDPDHP